MRLVGYKEQQDHPQEQQENLQHNTIAAFSLLRTQHTHLACPSTPSFVGSHISTMAKGDDKVVTIVDEFFRERKDWARWSKALVWALRQNEAEDFVNMNNLSMEGAPAPPEAPSATPKFFSFMKESSRVTLPTITDDKGMLILRTCCTLDEFYTFAADKEIRTFESARAGY
jgi:hypothetical protein